MVIAFTGKKRSGKDTCGNVLVQNYGFIRYRFADPIKELCKIVFLWNDEHIEGNLKEVVDKRWNISPRVAMQTIGTELFRERFPELHKDFGNLIGSNIWVQRFLYWYEEHKNEDIVVTDLRFVNEAIALESINATLIRVDSLLVSNSGDSHISETEMEKIVVDATFFNPEYKVESLIKTLNHYMVEKGIN